MLKTQAGDALQRDHEVARVTKEKHGVCAAFSPRRAHLQLLAGV